MQTVPPPVDQLVGEALGHYYVKQLLGHGNINAVYAAQQQPQGQTVMLTAFLLPATFSLQAREQFMTRFAQIASMLVRLDHPHILPTYDFGSQFGYPYLITPFVTGGSLARMLRQETRCAPQHVLDILKQIAAGLEYAHQNGMVHGTLKPTNILLDDEQNVRITGFGLANILRMADVESVASPYAHLLSVAGTFLGAPEYIAPEIVQGKRADARSDVYSLGIMLFELLTGQLPFSGGDPFVVALQHVQQQVPSLHVVCSDVLPGLDLVVQKAVDADPTQRFQSVDKLVSAFERVLAVIHEATSSGSHVKEIAPAMPEMTMPPTVNWDEESFSGDLWQMDPPLNGSMSKASNPRIDTGNWQLRPPIVTSQLAAIKAGRDQAARSNRRDQVVHSDRRDRDIAAPSFQRQYADESEMGARLENQKVVDPLALWTGNSAFEIDGQGPGTFDTPEYSASEMADVQQKPTNLGRRRASAKFEKSDVSDKGQKPSRLGRRRVIAMLATGGVVAAGVVGGGIGLMRFIHPQVAGTQAAAPQINKAGTNPQPGKPQAQTKPPTKASTTMTQKAPAANAPNATHTGTVVGMKNLATNSAADFKNPANNNDSLLVHLPNGKFVAYESACTHQQVPVVYHPETQKLVCPLHGSVFDPAQNGKVLQGPAGTPLPPVKLSVNGDGTITVA